MDKQQTSALTGNTGNLRDNTANLRSNDARMMSNSIQSSQPAAASTAATTSRRILKDEEDRRCALYEEEMRSKLKTARGTRPVEERESATAFTREKMQQKIQLHSKMALEELKKGRSSVAQPRGLATTSGNRNMRGGGAGEGAVNSHLLSQRSSRQQSQQDPTSSENILPRQTSKRLSPLPQKMPLLDPEEIGPAPAVGTAPVGRVKFALSSSQQSIASAAAAGRGDTAFVSGAGVGDPNTSANKGGSSVDSNESTLTLKALQTPAIEPTTAQPRSGRPMFSSQKSHGGKLKRSNESRDVDEDELDDDVNPLKDPFSSAGRAALKASLMTVNKTSPPKPPRDRAAPSLEPAHTIHDEQLRQRKLTLIQKHREDLGRLKIVNQPQDSATSNDAGKKIDIKPGQQMLESQVIMTTALKTVPREQVTASATPAVTATDPTATVTASMMPPPPAKPTVTLATPKDKTGKATSKPAAGDSGASSRRGSLVTVAVLARHLSQLDLSSIERLANSSDALMPSSARKNKERTDSGSYIPPYISSFGTAALGRRGSASSNSSNFGSGLRRARSQTDLTVSTAVDAASAESELTAPVLAAPLMAVCADGAASALNQVASEDSQQAVVDTGVQPMLVPAACIKSITYREDFARDLDAILTSKSARGRDNSRAGPAEDGGGGGGAAGGEKTFRCALIDILWLELCSWRHGLKVSEQEAFLLEGRSDAKIFYEELAAKQSIFTSRDCTCGVVGGTAGEAVAYYNSSVQDMDDDYLQCLTQTYMRIQEVLLRISQAEQLYPNTKQMETDIPLAASADVQSRIQALYMWRNMYYEMSVHLDAMADIVGISRKRSQMFPKLSRTLQRSQALAMLSRGLSMNTSESSDSGNTGSLYDDATGRQQGHPVGPCRLHHFLQYQQFHAAASGHPLPQQQNSVSTEDSGVSAAASSSNGKAKDFTSQSNLSLGSSMDSNLAMSLGNQLRVNSNARPAAALSPGNTSSVGSDFTAPSMSFTNTNTKTEFAELAAPRSAEHANLVILLRHYLIRNLRGGATQIVEQFSTRLTKLLNMRLEELRDIAPNGTTYRTIIKRLRLPSLEPVLFFLVRFPMHVLEEVMLIRQSQRPSSVLDYASLNQLKAETKEVLSLGSSARRLFVEQASKLASAESRNTTKKDLIEATLERYDDIFHASINLYLDYLMDAVMSAYRSSQRFGTQQKEMLEAEWKFVWSKLDDLDESNYMLPKAFCEISSQIFVLISEFVKLGMTEFRADLAKACEEGGDGGAGELTDSGDSVNTEESEEEVEEEEDDEGEEEDGESGNGSDDDDDEEEEEEEVKDPVQMEIQRKRDAFRMFIRRCKLLCKQSSDRSQGALKFAKLLRKDLEISAVYERTQALTLDKLMDSLVATGHQRVEFKPSITGAASDTALNNITADDTNLLSRKGSQFMDDMAMLGKQLAPLRLSTENLATASENLKPNSSGASLADESSAVKNDVAAPAAADFSHTMFFVPQNISQNTDLVKLIMNTPIGTPKYDGLDNGYLLVVPVNETRLPATVRNAASRENMRKRKQTTKSDVAGSNNDVTSEEEEEGDDEINEMMSQSQYKTSTQPNTKRSTVFDSSGKSAAFAVKSNETERTKIANGDKPSTSLNAGEAHALRLGIVRSLSSEAAVPGADTASVDGDADNAEGDGEESSGMVKNRWQRRRSSQMSIESMRLMGRSGIAAWLAQQVEWHGESLVLNESVDSDSFSIFRNSLHVREREVQLLVLRNSELFFKRRDFERALLGHLAQLAVRSSNSNSILHKTGSNSNVSAADAPMIMCKRLQSPCYTRIFLVLQEVKTQAVVLGQTLLDAFRDIERETLRIDELGMGHILGSVGDATTGGHMSLSQLRNRSQGDGSSTSGSSVVPPTPLTPSGSSATTLQSSARTLLVYLYDRLMEYTRELARLFSKAESVAISLFLVDVARAWANFVLARCPEGRLGIRPRWAHTGFEFLRTAMQPVHTCHINNEDFDTLQDLIRVCVSHIVGDTPVSDDEDENDDIAAGIGYGIEAAAKLPLSQKHASLLGVGVGQPKSLSWATSSPPFDPNSSVSPIPPPTPALPDSIPSELHAAETERMLVAKNKPTVREATMGSTAAVEAAIAAPAGAHLPPGMSMAAAASMHTESAATKSVVAFASPQQPEVQQHLTTKAAPQRYWSNVDDYLTGYASGMFQVIDDESEMSEVSPALAQLLPPSARISSDQNQTMPLRSASPDIGSAAAAGDAAELSRSLNVTTSGTGGVTMPLLRFRLGCSKADKRRNDRLQREKRIGRVAAGKADTTKHLRSRRVNFRWQRGELLGQGKFGKVYQAVNLDEGRAIAVKLFQDTSGPQAKQFVELMKAIDREMITLEGLKHENIIKYYGVEVHRDEVCIFMEFCGGGDLAVASRQGLPIRLVRIYTAQVLRGIQYLHDNKILHLDIKGENILLTGDGDLIKICDFNTAIKLRTSMTMTADVPEIPVGTPAFMAPEMINRTSTPGRGADIWSIGCCVVQMLTGKPPFFDMQNSFQVMYAIGQGRSPKIPEQTPKDGKDFLANTFIAMPQHRPMASDLLHYKFVAGV